MTFIKFLVSLVLACSHYAPKTTFSGKLALSEQLLSKNLLQAQELKLTKS